MSFLPQNQDHYVLSESNASELSPHCTREDNFIYECLYNSKMNRSMYTRVTTRTVTLSQQGSVLKSLKMSPIRLSVRSPVILQV